MTRHGHLDNIRRKRVTVDEQTRKVLDLLRLQGPLPLDAREMRRLSRESLPPLERERQQVEAVSDMSCPGSAHAIPLRVYRPRRADSLGTVPPLLVYFHGGGHTIGSLDGYDGLCCMLARASGCVVVSVDYRLAPEHPFPAAPQDCWAATAWIAAHAGELGGDASRVVVAGDSAGGNLAAVVALMARDRGSPRLAAQVLIYPVTDLLGDTPSRQRNAEGYLLTREMIDWFHSQYLSQPEDGLHPHAAPLRADNHSGLPPALVITVEFDPLLDEGEAYVQRLAAAGVPVRHVRFDATVHGFLNFYRVIDKARQAINLIGEHLRQSL